MNPAEGIQIGATGEEKVVVVEELTVGHFVKGMPMVYGTPMMIYLMEMASANAINPALPDGWVSVGAEVSIKHLAATPVGRTVTARGEVTAIDGRVVHFRVEAHDGVRKIGEGTHSRGLVNLEKFEQRLAQDSDG